MVRIFTYEIILLRVWSEAQALFGANYVLSMLSIRQTFQCHLSVRI